MCKSKHFIVLYPLILLLVFGPASLILSKNVKNSKKKKKKKKKTKKFRYQKLSKPIKFPSQ